MTPENSTDAPSARRTRVREAALQEIKAAAREHLLRYGPGELSLRAVARDVGVTPSALYRYFDSRGALVAALSADALESAIAAVSSASSDEGLAPSARLRAMFVAMRAWTLSHRSEFELVFANREEQTRPDMAHSVQMQQLVSLPLTEAMAALADGSITPSASPPALSAAAMELVEALPADVDRDLLAPAMFVCTSCFGWLYLEHFGLVTWAVDEGESAFASYLDCILGARP